MVSETIPDPQPADGQVVVKLEAAGVNFIDIYQRTGLYALPLPFIPGNEAAGVVERVGANVNGLRPGDRVAYAMVPGAYAERAAVPAARAVKVPDGVSLQDAAALMLQGMTAHYLTRTIAPLTAGQTVLLYAAAGGVGLHVARIAKSLGVHVIGVVSTDEKARMAREAGAEHVLMSGSDLAGQVKEITNGRGVDVVYDSVGKDTIAASLDALRPRGMLILFGQSSGPVPTIDTSALARKALFFTRPGLAYYTATTEELQERASAVFDWLRAGTIRVHIDRVLPLDEAAEAHRLLASRKTMGKLLLSA
jgi:NADPH2:quinone reductase